MKDFGALYKGLNAAIAACAPVAKASLNPGRFFEPCSRTESLGSSATR